MLQLDVDEKAKQAIEATRKFAESLGGKALESWEQSLEFLSNFQSGKSICRLYVDDSPYSFGFVLYSKLEDGSIGRFLTNGALIFHGPHDGGGSGAAPTFCVSMGSLNGDTEARWEIHT